MTAQSRNTSQANQERDEAQERFQIAFDTNPAPSMIVQLSDERVLVTNSGLHEISGRENDEVKGRSIRELELFDDHSAFRHIIEALERGESTSKVTLAMRSVDQGCLTVLVSAAPITLDEGACGIFTFTDVTELKHAEDLFSQTFRLAPVPMTLIDTETRFVEVNESFHSLTGYTRDEVIGHKSHKLRMWSSPDDYRSIRDALKGKNEFHNLELSLRTKSGEERYIIGSAKLLTVAGEQVLLHIFYDVTERKRTEYEMHQAIRTIMSDTTWFSRSLIDQLNRIRGGGESKTLNEIKLSEREKEVLEGVARGLSNAAISNKLGIKAQTVRNYISNIYSKINVHSRAEAIVWARERGIN